MPISKARETKNAAYVKALSQLGRRLPQVSTSEWVRSGFASFFSRKEDIVIQSLNDKENNARINTQSALELTESILNNLEPSSPIVRNNRRKLDLLKVRMAGLLSQEQLVGYGREVESFESLFVGIETDADEITDECIAFLDLPTTKEKLSTFLQAEQTNMIGCVNSFAKILKGDSDTFFAEGIKFGKIPEFGNDDAPRTMEIANKKYIIAELKRMFRVILGEIHNDYPNIDFNEYLSKLDAIDFSPDDTQTINLIRSRFGAASQEIYAITGTIFQQCSQELPTTATSADTQLFFRGQISSPLDSADASDLRVLTTISNGDCGPHTVVLSLLFGGMFGKLPRNLAAQILLDWYCMYGQQVRTDTAGNKQLADKDFQAFLIEFLSVKTDADIKNFSNKYFSKTDNHADNITPFLTRCARKAAQDYYNTVTAKEHEDALGVLPVVGRDIDEAESFIGYNFTDLEHTTKLLWKRYNIPSLIKGYDDNDINIAVYGDSEFTDMNPPLVWTRQGNATEDVGHYIFAFDPEDTMKIDTQDNSDFIEHLKTTAINKLMSPVAVAAQENYHLPQQYVEQKSKHIEDDLALQQAQLKQLQEEEIARARLVQQRLEQEEQLPQRPIKKKEVPTSGKKAARQPTSTNNTTVRFASSPPSTPLRVEAEEEPALNLHQIELYGPHAGKGLIPLAYDTFNNDDKLNPLSNFYIKKAAKDTTKHDVFVKENQSDRSYDKKISTLIEPTDPKKLVTAEFYRSGKDSYYDNALMLLTLANKKIKDENLPPDSIGITIPNLYTRDQAQQFFLAYYEVFGASIDPEKQIGNQDPFKKFLFIENPPIDAQKAFYRLFHEKKAFTDWMTANPDDVKRIAHNNDIGEATMLLDAAFACFATHLGYQPPGVTPLSSNREGPNEKFFDGYTYKPNWFFRPY